MLVHDRIYLDGEWHIPCGTRTTDITDPAREKTVARIRLGDGRDIDRAVAAAQHALPHWSSRPAGERAQFLAALARSMRDHARELASLITAEMGAPPDFALSEHVELPVDVLDGYAALAEEYEFTSRLGNSLIVRAPVGVVAAITPWNYPLYQLVLKMAPALLAGCTVVAKPSELTPLSAYRLTELLHETGLPAGVFNLVPGTGDEAGTRLTGHPDVDAVSFTGSTRAGRSIAERAGGAIKRVALELGGKSPSVVLPGTDLETATRATVDSCFANAGQTCSSWTRLLVPRAEHDRAVRIAAGRAGELEPELGPLISTAQYQHVQQLVAAGLEEGAELVCGGPGTPPNRSTGHYVRATVFGQVTSGMRIAREEVFGPVLAVLPYGSPQEAVELANDSEYGLAAAVWAPDQSTALAVAHRIDAGQVDINGADFNPRAPFGGFKRSGIGRELGPFGLEEFTEIKSIQL